MIPHLFVEPISENVIIVTTASGAAIEISDSGGFGADIHIAETKEGLRLAKFKRIKVITKEADAAGTFRVEMAHGVRIP
jgi:hypothetical protein